MAMMARAPAQDAAKAVAEKAQLCAACHGASGVPIDKKTPVIWGQQAGYLYLQLRDFKSGARKNPIMGPMAQSLKHDEMLALAEYFSKKQWPQLGQPPAPADVAHVAEQANSSIGCTGCHQGDLPGRGHAAASRRSAARISLEPDAGFPRRLARQQSGHVGPDEGGQQGAARRHGALSRRHSLVR